MLEQLKNLRVELMKELGDRLLGDVYESGFTDIPKLQDRLETVNYLISCLEYDLYEDTIVKVVDELKNNNEGETE